MVLEELNGLFIPVQTKGPAGEWRAKPRRELESWYCRFATRQTWTNIGSLFRHLRVHLTFGLTHHTSSSESEHHSHRTLSLEIYVHDSD